ncbi:MAG: hypothetical protein CSB16_03010 [Clostridiales bacterium]|nr:MAG: hypothetical protein CSB16_03010 [Clostridiales bacterium]
MSYKDTFITVAPDCPVDKSEIPVSTRAKKPLHIIQYELLTENPYKFDHNELVFEVYLIREGLENISETERKEVWEKLFSKGHPCLRASALTKRYGFGAHYDKNGKIAIYPMESDQYQKFVKNKSIKKLAGMKRKR